jgi:hypothetical protein
MPYLGMKRITGDEIRGIPQFIHEFTLSTPTLSAGKINAFHLAHPHPDLVTLPHARNQSLNS